jgi:hypothetical protein
VFEKDEPVCFITLVEYRALDGVTPEIVPLDESPEIAAQYKDFRQARESFNAALASNDPLAVKQGWQKWYLRGESPFGGVPSPIHASRLSLAAPIERHGSAPHLVPETKKEKP